MGVQEWSANDINKARSYFLNGFTVKEIARELGRTTSATNKALSRFGIRFKKSNRNNTERNDNEIATQSKEKAGLSIVTPSLVAPSFAPEALRKEFENWVSFWRVCEYLGEQNICLYEVSSPNAEVEYRQFRVGAQILSARQLLMLANKIRTENNMRAFFVKGLSW